MAGVGGQRQARADPDLENAALALVDDFHRVLASLGRDLPEGVVVDRRPAAVGILHGMLIYLRAAGAILETLEELRSVSHFGTRRRRHRLFFLPLITDR